MRCEEVRAAAAGREPLGAEAVSEVARFAAGQLLDHPAWLFGLGIAAALAGWGWARIDLELAATMRESA